MPQTNPNKIVTKCHNMFLMPFASSGDSTAAAIRKHARTKPELRLPIVPGLRVD